MNGFWQKIGNYLSNHERRQALCLLGIYLLLLGACLYCGAMDVMHSYHAVYTVLTFITAGICFICLVVMVLLYRGFTRTIGTTMSWIGVVLGAMTTFCLLVASRDKVYLLFYLPGAIFAAIILFDILQGVVVSGFVIVLSVAYLYIPSFNGENPSIDSPFRLTFMIVLVFAVIISLISVVGRQMIENSVRQFAVKYRELAYRDSLTSLYNHSYYVHCADNLSLIAGDGDALGVLFIDLDGLKKINDIHGHPVGNEALIAVSRAMESCNPSTLIRYAGDEFVILEPRMDRGELMGEASRIIKAVEKIVLKSTPDLKLTVSIGIYVDRVSSTTNLDDFVKAADKQLYISKHRGKDTVSAA